MAHGASDAGNRGIAGLRTTPAALQVSKAPNGVEIVVTGGDVVTGHDPASGKELWRVDGLEPDQQPLQPHHRVPGRRRRHPDCAHPRAADARDQGRRPRRRRAHAPPVSFDNGPDVPTPVSDGKLLYTITDRGVAYALELATGKVVYGPQRLRPDSYSASPVLADDRIYVTSENEGLTSVYRAGPKFELLAENPLEDYCLSSPAISEGQIFIRTTGHLWAIGQRKKAS